MEYGLGLLRSDPACKTAAFHSSKSQFSVVRMQDKARKNFRVLGLKRKREAAASSDSRDLQDAFDQRLQEAMAWMAGPADGPAEDHDEEGESDQGHSWAGKGFPSPRTLHRSDDSDEEAPVGSD